MWFFFKKSLIFFFKFRNYYMAPTILFIVYLCICLAGGFLALKRTGNYDVDFFTKIIGWVMLIFGVYGIFELIKTYVNWITMKIHIEFCIKWNYDPEFERVSNIIIGINPKVEVSSNESPPRSGAFEVTVDNKIVFSKFKSNRFPTEIEIRSWI